jgi:hypothetical protein
VLAAAARSDLLEDGSRSTAEAREAARALVVSCCDLNWVSALAAAERSLVLDVGSRNTFEACDAAPLLVCRDICGCSLAKRLKENEDSPEARRAQCAVDPS